MPDPQMSVDDFAGKIKAKYPDYANISNDSLVAAVVAKHPEYRDQVNFAPNAGLASPGAPPKVQMQEQPTVLDSLRHLGSNAMTAIKGVGSEAYDTGAGLLKSLNPNNIPAAQMAEGYKDSVQDVIQQSHDAADQGNVPKSMFMSVAAGVPLVGPGAAKIYNLAESGHNAEAVGRGGVQAALAALLHGDTRALVGDAVDNAASSIPSKARAGQNFAEVKSAAGDVPIDVNAPGATALQIDQLARSGGSMPKVVRDFLRRTTDPDSAPLTYAEARDFYSNATRISVDEFNRLTPTMKLKLGQFTHELGKSIGGAADEAGVGDQYSGAMDEYKNAARLEAKVKVGKELASESIRKAVPYAVGAYAAKKVWDAR